MLPINQIRRKAFADRFNQNQDDPYGQMNEDNPVIPSDNPLPISGNLPNAESSYRPGMLQTIGQAQDAEDAKNQPFDLRDLYQEDTDATKRFEDLLSQYPKDDKPSWARGIMAAGINLGNPKGGIKEGMDYLDRPHDKEVEDWKNKAQPFYEAANLERQGNINNRTLAYNTMQARAADKRNQILEDRYENQSEAAIMRNLINKYKAEDYKIVTMGTRIKAVNPHDPNDVKDIGDSGKMDQRELEELKGGYQVKAAEARGTAAIATVQAGAQAAGKGYVQIGDKLYMPDPNNSKGLIEVEGAPPGVATRPGTPPRTTGTGTKTNTLEDNRQRQDRMRDLYETYPDDVKRFIKKDAGGKYTLSPRPTPSPGGVFSKEVTQEDVNKWDEVKSKIDPGYTPPANDLKKSTVDHSQDHPTYFPGQKDVELPAQSGKTSNRQQANTIKELTIVDPKTGRTGKIPNDKDTINYYQAHGYRIEVGK